MVDHHQSTSDFSLRHLPDMSQPNASLSFEIPLVANSADLLLADHSDDFLDGVDYSLTTPPPPKGTLNTPLTLSELTPTYRAAPIVTVQTLSPSLHRRNTKWPETVTARLSPRKTPQSVGRTRPGTPKLVDSPVGAVRLANLKAEVDSLLEDSAEEVEPPKPAAEQVRTTKRSAARLKRGTKLPKGDELKPKMKAVRLLASFYIDPELMYIYISDSRRWWGNKERHQG
jgi:hypothetical protein